PSSAPIVTLSPAAARDAGTAISPSPRKVRGADAYMRAEAARICPIVRSRPIRIGAVGVQVMPRTIATASAIAAIATIVAIVGSMLAARTALDPAATAPQKKSVARVSSTPPAGTAKLCSRQSDVHEIGRCHRSDAAGPSGPL